MEASSAFDFAGNRIIRQSEPMTIGKHDWRLTRYRSQHYDRPLIGYEWRRTDGSPIRRKCPGGIYYLDGSTWMRDEDWPSYNHNDGEYAGLPRTLRKLWEQCPWAHTRDARPA